MPRRTAVAAVSAAACLILLGGCASTKTGTGRQAPAVTSASSSVSSSTPATTSAAVTSSSASTAPSVTLHPVPAQPLRTATVDGGGAYHYVIKIWADVKNSTCADHAFGPMAQFLTTHRCGGMERLLATTTVNGQAVGFAVTNTNFPDPPGAPPYSAVDAFRAYVEKDGTGSINDLMREGYRLPSGPTSVPSPDAFTTVGQDAGVSVYDIWYLAGPTPQNDPPLIKMAQNIFLQY